MIELKLNMTEANKLLVELEAVVSEYDALIDSSEDYSERVELEKSRNNLEGIFKRLRKAVAV